MINLRLNNIHWKSAAPLLNKINNFNDRSRYLLQHRISYSVAQNIPITKQSGFLRRNSGRILATLGVVGCSVVLFDIYQAKHPLPQLPLDPTKKTIAILGSGWAATSLLKELDNREYNVVVVSPRNYFLFTPLLPSCTTGTIELRSIMQPIRYITRHMKRQVMFVEGNCTDIDPEVKQICVEDNSEIVGEISKQYISYDHLVIACGAENATFGIKGVNEFACFLKEAWDARKIRTKLMDCIETAAFPGQPESEIDRLLHMVVVGGGPTGVEYAAELYDFLHEDLIDWYPELAGKIKITLIEALPNVLPMFSKQLIAYTQKQFASQNIQILNSTSVKEVKQKELLVLNAKKELETIPYGLLVWATGNAARSIVANLIKKYPEFQKQRRGLEIDSFLEVKGMPNVYCIGDASASTYPATAQVASKEGQYLAKRLNEVAQYEAKKKEYEIVGLDINELKDISKPEFSYDHKGTLAYIGSDKAIADLPGNLHIGGALTFYFWRSAYLSNLFAFRNKILVCFDWTKKTVFGRDTGRE